MHRGVGSNIISHDVSGLSICRVSFAPIPTEKRGGKKDGTIQVSGWHYRGNSNITIHVEAGGGSSDKSRERTHEAKLYY